jgi:uncharacterized membrane protein
MMDGMQGMGSMMAWMMGLGLLGWVLVIALLATIVVLLFQLLSRTRSSGDRPPPASGEPPAKPR